MGVMSRGNSMQTWLTVAEGAKQLKINEKTLRRWLSTGQVRGEKFGRVWRIRAAVTPRHTPVATLDGLVLPPIALEWINVTSDNGKLRTMTLAVFRGFLTYSNNMFTVSA